MSPEELQRMASDARPRLTWRIGITGHRDLSAADPIELRRWFDQVFDDVAAALQSVMQRKDADAVFSSEPPLIAIVSPLAEGADRLCAEMAVDRGFELRAPLPFAESEYSRDVPDTVKDFDRLIDRARTTGGVVNLGGDTEQGEPRNKAYMAVGEFVVRNCDLLIALWDGKPSRGYGGT